MAKRPKQRTKSPLPPAVLRARVERAAQEDRYQHALELGKQLCKQDPSTANHDLLRKIYLGRAQQLRKQGYTRDAQIVLDNAVQLADGDPAWLGRLAEELALCGGSRRALDLVRQIPGSPAQSRILARAVDGALQQGAAGRKQLPEALAAPFDLILQAFLQLEAGEDDRVRETLQGIGLQCESGVQNSPKSLPNSLGTNRDYRVPGTFFASPFLGMNCDARVPDSFFASPFLEWKVLLRGLLAFYHDGKERTLENWQRLDPERLPARLAAPLRFQIDPAYRQAQPPAVQAALQKQADRLQDSGLVQPLRILQAVLADPDQLPQAFRLAEGLLQALRQQFPHLVPRLTACFYWAMINGGQPEDVSRYERIFGTPSDDPGLDRPRALLFEHLGDMAKAHEHWQWFEASVARNPAAWPGEQAGRVRALIWCRMGRNAASVPDPDKIPDLPPFLRNHPDRPRPLSPSAPECFRRSLELAPDQLDAHEELFHYHAQEEDEAEAERAARRLLEHFPNHVATLVALSGIRGHRGDHAEALSLLQRALRANPLDRALRTKVGTAHLFNARSHAEAGRFAEARVEYQMALSYREGKDGSSVWCKWAACEFQAQDSARAEELLQKALAESGSRLAVAYNMLIETIRLKLSRKLKSRFTKDFKTALAEPPMAAAAKALAETAASYHVVGVTYRGQKSYDKQVLAYLEKALKVEFSEDQLESIATSLLELKALKVLRKFTTLGRRRFQRNSHFYFLEAESYFAKGPYRFPAWRVQPLLSKAGQLAHELPADERQKALLEKIEQRQQMLGVSNFLFSPQSLGMLEEMFGQVLGGYDNEFDDHSDDHDGY